MTEARYSQPRISAAGDAALLVELGDGIDEALNRRVHALARAIEDAAIPGVVDVIPAYRSVLVCYDPVQVVFNELQRDVAALATSLDHIPAAPPRVVEIPTCYGGDFGPDLPFVAGHAGLPEDDVIATHAAGRYVVFMMGFSPGFAYLGGMSPSIAAPRLKTPRTAIPAGSVGIAQQQTGIYPIESPGGWQLIGRTPVRLFAPRQTPPTLLEPGDVVRFVRIDDARYRAIEEDLGAQHLAPLPGADADPGMGGPNESPFVEVLHPGGLSTIQDLGRYGFQRYGVPVSGAMDTFAARVANLLVGNDERCAVLEMTLTGPQLLFAADTIVAVTGADMQPRTESTAASTWQPFLVPAGAVLSFGAARAGTRAYLAVQGGFGVPAVLGSRSTYLRSALGGFHGRVLAPGDRLPLGTITETALPRQMPTSYAPTYVGSHRVRVVPGPQQAAFTPSALQVLLSSAFTITAQSDRMGYRLDGPHLDHRTSADIVSDGTPAGAVQVAGDGLPLVLLSDRGTTGGYAKIATVITADLPRLAQSQPGDRLFFDAVTVEEAHAAARKLEALVEQVRHARPADVGTRGEVGHLASGVVRPAAPRSRSAVAPLPGTIIEIRVAEGDVVERGQILCVLEAMKMHNAVSATSDGRVVAVRVAAGDQVRHGQVLVEIG